MLNSMFNFLETSGFFIIVIPFVAIFAITYGLLQKSKIFDKLPRDSSFSGIISFAIGLMFIANQNRVNVFNKLILCLILSLFITFLFKLLLGLFHSDLEIFKGRIFTIAIIVFFTIPFFVLFGLNKNSVLIIFLNWLWQYFGFLIILFGIIFYITNENPKEYITRLKKSSDSIKEKQSKTSQEDIKEPELKNYYTTRNDIDKLLRTGDKVYSHDELEKLKEGETKRIN